MVKTGLDVLIKSHLKLFQSKRVGIISNPSGVTFDLVQNVDALKAAGVKVTAIYAPEHGFRGAAKEGEKVDTYVDEITGITVYSLYGKGHKPSQEMLQDVDVLLFDLQDAGARFYTFISTLLDAMEACKEHGKICLVLDRPNPVNGNDVEGNILDMNFKTFVGYSPIPIRYGLTLGELSRFYNAHFKLQFKELVLASDTSTLGDAQLVIAPISGWKREMYFDETGLQWVCPSPNFATVDTAIVFPGCCFIEGTNASEGRGTVRPFEWIGAPYIDADKWAHHLNQLNLPGIRFRPNYFVPRYQKNEGNLCFGIQVHLLDRHQFIPTLTGLHIVNTLYHLFQKDFKWIKFERYFLDNLLGGDMPRKAIEAGESMDAVFARWKKDSDEFKKLRKPYLIYK
jgi:uncharacterized protein YbbC (DUF1343 family)